MAPSTYFSLGEGIGSLVNRPISRPLMGCTNVDAKYILFLYVRAKGARFSIQMVT